MNGVWVGGYRLLWIWIEGDPLAVLVVLVDCIVLEGVWVVP